MSVINILGIDPAICNTGLAIGRYNLDTGELDIKRVSLVQTENAAGKTVRKASDDYRRARAMLFGICRFIKEHGATFAVAEVPTGTQSARGAMSNGICCGVLAGVPLPLIEVSPTEVKLASAGKKTATKDEIIAWAVKRWPDAGWMRHERNGATYKKGDLMKDNEHMADACAAIAAGIETTQFAQAIALMARAPAAALPV